MTAHRLTHDSEGGSFSAAPNTLCERVYFSGSAEKETSTLVAPAGFQALTKMADLSLPMFAERAPSLEQAQLEAMLDDLRRAGLPESAR